MNRVSSVVCILAFLAQNFVVPVGLANRATGADETKEVPRQQTLIRRHIEAGTITSVRSLFVIEAMWSRTKLLAGRNRVKIIGDPNSHKIREQLVRKDLGVDFYTELETILLEAVKSSPGRSNIQVAVRMLGKGLASSRARPVVEEKLDEETSKLLDSNKENDPHPNLLYYLAEALCYMGDESGLYFVKQVIESESKDITTGRRCAAIRALTALSTTRAKAILRKNKDSILLSGYPTVATCALKNLQVIDEFESYVNQAAYKLLSRFATDNNLTSSREQIHLLMNVKFVLYDLIDKDKLSAKERVSVKKSVRSILHNRPTEYGDRVAVLFAMLSDDEDRNTMSMMLRSESSTYRAQGARSVVTGSRDLKEYFLPDLIRLLDDSDSQARDHALLAIRRYKGEFAGSGLSKERFEKERARIKQWWKERGRASHLNY